MTLLIILGAAIAWMLFGWILVLIVCYISESINNEIRHDPTFAIVLALMWPMMVVMVSGQLIAEHFNPATLASNMKKRREEKAKAKELAKPYPYDELILKINAALDEIERNAPSPNRSHVIVEGYGEEDD